MKERNLNRYLRSKRKRTKRNQRTKRNKRRKNVQSASGMYKHHGMGGHEHFGGMYKHHGMGAHEHFDLHNHLLNKNKN